MNSAILITVPVYTVAIRDSADQSAIANQTITPTPTTGNQTTIPVANFTATPTSGTAPLTVQFNDTSENYPTSWNWSFGDGDNTNATQQNPVHRYVSAGTYTIVLTAANAAGKESSPQ